MATEVIMPKAGMSMESGTIIRWIKAVGDEVTAGEPLVEIETDKVAMEVEAEQSGYLIGIVHDEGAEVAVTEPIGWIGTKDETPPAATTAGARPVAAAEHPNAVATPHSPESTVARTTPTAADAARVSRTVRATPAARRIAAERGVDLGRTTGSGPDGAVLIRDLEERSPDRDAAADEASTQAADIEEITLSGVRASIARRMLDSHLSIPPITLRRDVRVDALLAAKDDLLDQSGVKVSVSDLIIRSVALALPDHPLLRTHLIGETLYRYRAVNIGIAVALPAGLMVPVVRNAERLSLARLAETTSQLIERVRDGEAGPDDFAGGVFTITNLGMMGVDSFTAIVNPPQSGILGVGRIREEVAIKNGAATAVKTMSLMLTADHRVVDGAVAAAFLNDVARRIEHPESLGIDTE